MFWLFFSWFVGRQGPKSAEKQPKYVPKCQPWSLDTAPVSWFWSPIHVFCINPTLVLSTPTSSPFLPNELIIKFTQRQTRHSLSLPSSSKNSQHRQGPHRHRLQEVQGEEGDHPGHRLQGARRGRRGRQDEDEEGLRAAKGRTRVVNDHFFWIDRVFQLV